MQIRLAQVADAAEIARVHVDTWRAAYRGIVPDAHLDSLTYEQREQRWRDNFATASPGVFVYVATEEAGRVIGFAGGGPSREGLGTLPGFPCLHLYRGAELGSTAGLGISQESEAAERIRRSTDVAAPAVAVAAALDGAGATL